MQPFQFCVVGLTIRVNRSIIKLKCKKIIYILWLVFWHDVCLNLILGKLIIILKINEVKGEVPNVNLLL